MDKKVYDRLEKIAAKFENKLRKFAQEMETTTLLDVFERKLYDKFIGLSKNNNFLNDLKALGLSDGKFDLKFKTEADKIIEDQDTKTKTIIPGAKNFQISGASGVDTSSLNKYFKVEEIKKITDNKNVLVNLFEFSAPEFKVTKLKARP